MKNCTALIAILFLLMFSQNAIAQWTWLNPQPNGNDHTKVRFISDSIGIILNNFEVIRTSDSGESWEVIQELDNPKDVCFEEETGYIVCDGGIVYRSIDYGLIWSQIALPQLPSQPHLNSVHLFSADTVIITGRQIIIKSFNGGIDWEVNNLDKDYMDQTVFRNSAVGHAICNRNNSGHAMIKKTIDGGLTWDTTWTSGSHYYAMTALYFFNDSVGYAYNGYNGMLKTSTFGNSWAPTYSCPTESIYDYSFVNENVGFATGEYGLFYRTLDGGVIWERTDFNGTLALGNDLFSIYFNSTDVGYLAGQNGMIYKTTNQGNDWTSNSFGFKNIYDLCFPTPDVGFASTWGKIIKTDDLGITWSDLNVDIEGFAPKIQFIDEQIGYWTEMEYSNEKFYKTEDGGQTKSQLDLGFDFTYISSFFFLDASIGFVSVQAPYEPDYRGVYKTVNGGHSWIRVSNEDRLNQMQFVNTYMGFAIKDDDQGFTLYKTADAGQTWNSVLDNSLGDGITSFYFVNEYIGYAIGNGSFTAKSVDGGDTWHIDYKGAYYNPVNLKFFNEGVGVFFGHDYFYDKGLICSTFDGGENWDRTLISGVDEFKTASISPSGFVIAGGSYGMLLSNNISTLSSESYEINELNNQSQSFYPNPASSVLTFNEKTITKAVEITLVDLNGRVIREINPNTISQIDVSGYIEGIYIIIIRYEETTIVEKLIVK